MSDYGKETKQTTESTGPKRWHRIMELPERTPFVDLSTGLEYTRGQFRPLHKAANGDLTEKESFATKVEEFQIIGTQERVTVDFLRLASDSGKYGNRCSLVSRPA